MESCRVPETEHVMVAAIARITAAVFPRSVTKPAGSADSRRTAHCFRNGSARLAAALDRRPEPVIASIRTLTSKGALDVALIPERLNQNLSLEQWSLESCAPVVKDVTGLDLSVRVQR